MQFRFPRRYHSRHPPSLSPIRILSVASKKGLSVIFTEIPFDSARSPVTPLYSIADIKIPNCGCVSAMLANASRQINGSGRMIPDFLIAYWPLQTLHRKARRLPIGFLRNLLQMFIFASAISIYDPQIFYLVSPCYQKYVSRDGFAPRRGFIQNDR